MELRRRLRVQAFLLVTAALALLTTSFGVLYAPAASAAQTVPYKINFQGRLTDNNGNALSDGLYNVKFRLWTAVTSGTNMWEEDRVITGTDNRVQVTNGLFNIQFGDLTALSPSLFATGAAPLYLEVELPTPATATCATNGCAVFTEGAMTPRQAMASAAYAFNSDTLDGLDSSAFGQLSGNNSFTGANTFTPATGVGITVKPTASAHAIDVESSAGTIQAFFDSNGILNVGQTIQATVATVDLGTAANTFRTGYFGTSVQTPALNATTSGGTIATNLGTLQRTAAGTTTLDLKDAGTTTLAVTNSGGGVAGISATGGLTIGTGKVVTVGAAAGTGVSCSSGQVLDAAIITGGIVTGGTCIASGGGDRLDGTWTSQQATTATNTQTTINFTGGANSTPSFNNATHVLTLPSSASKLVISSKGGGGGGGGTGTTNVANKMAGGGGEGGSAQYTLAGSLAANYYLKVGAGGTAGATTPTAGGTGTSTCFGTSATDACTTPLTSAIGGTGGTSSNVVCALVTTVAGGSGTGDLVTPGAPAGENACTTATGVTLYSSAGGGNDGGKLLTTALASAGTANAGAAGTGGGGGGSWTTGANAGNGGVGGTGYQSITVYTTVAGQGSPATLQTAYDNAPAGGITLSSSGLAVNDSSGGVAGDLLDVQNNAGTVNYLAVSSTGVSTSGTFTGSGSGLTNLAAGNLTGSYAALNGSAITSLNPSNLTTGTGAVTVQSAAGTDLAVTTTTTGNINLNTASGNINLNPGSSTSGVIVGPTVNSMTAFQVQNATDQPIFLVDTVTSVSTNFVTYGGFEAGTTTPTGWTAIGAPTTFARNTTAPNHYGGLASLQIVTTATAANQGATTSTFFSAPPAGNVYVSFYAEQTAGTALASNTLQVVINGTATACAAGTTLSAAGFQRILCPVTGAAAATSLGIQVPAASAGVRTIYLDGVQMVAGTAPEPATAAGAIQLRGAIDSPVVFQALSNSNTAFQIQNSAGTSSTFVVDTLNNRIGIGKQSPTTTLDVNGVANATSYDVGGTAGLATLTCSGGQLLQNASVSGGITTAGSCVAAPTVGASTTLNNLGTTAINASLIPATNNSIDLGTTSLAWSDVFSDNFDTGTISTALTIGTANAASIQIGKTGVAVSFPGGITTSGGTINTGSGSITTTGALSAGGITGTSLGLGTGNITTTGSIGGGAITGTSLGLGTGTITSGLINGQTIGNAGSFVTSLTAPTINASTTLQVGGASINTGGGTPTLSDVDYLDSAQSLSATKTFTKTTGQAAIYSGTAASAGAIIQFGSVAALSGGNTNGTYIGSNPATFTGDLINLQINNVAKLKVDNSGNGTLGGGLTIASGSVFTVGAAAGQPATVSCAANQAVTAAVFTGGILTTAPTCSAITGTGANTALSNVAATSIGAALISSANNTQNIGSAANVWQDVYTGNLDAGTTTTALTIGTTNAASIALGKTTVGVSVPGSISLGAPTSTVGQVTFYDSANSNTEVLKGSASVTTSYTTVLPNAIGSANQCLYLATVAAPTQTLGYTSCANTTLSNLGTTSINAALLSSGNNTIDLGSSANVWKDLYAGNIDAGTTTTALTVGTANAASITIGKTTVGATLPGSISLGAPTSTVGQITFYDSANANTEVLKGSPSVTTSYSTVLPSAIGAANQCLNLATVAAPTQTLGYFNCANTTLSDLGTTAINAALLSSGNNTQSVGAAGNVWQNVFTGNVDAGTTTTALTVGTAATTTAVTIGRAAVAVSVPGGLTTSGGAINTGTGTITSTGTITGNLFSGSGASLTNLNPTNLVQGSGAVILQSANATLLTLDGGTTGGVSIGSSANAKTITIGNTTLATAVNISAGTGGINLGDDATTKEIDIGGVTNDGTDTVKIATNGTANADNVTIGNAAAGTAITIDAGNTGTLQVGNSTAAHTINIGAGGAAAGNAQTITVGSGTTTTASKLSLQGGNITTTNDNSGIIIGGGYSASDTNLVGLTLDSSATFAETANTCTATVNGGSLYYNSASNAIRGCVSGSWEDIVTTSGLGILTFGIVPDSGSAPGDIGSIASSDVSGPCKVSWATATTVKIVNGCSVYTGGRKVIVPDNTTPTGTLTFTNGNTVHVCMTTANTSQPAFLTSGAETANLPAFSINNPIVCLADIKTSATAITSIYDTRVFTNSTKEYRTVAAAAGLGELVVGTGTTANEVTTTATAGTAMIRGVIVAGNGAAATTTINAIVVTQGQQFVKMITVAGTVNNWIQTGTTAGYGQSAATTATATNYAWGGPILRANDTTCTAATNCQFAALIDFEPSR